MRDDVTQTMLGRERRNAALDLLERSARLSDRHVKYLLRRSVIAGVLVRHRNGRYAATARFSVKSKTIFYARRNRSSLLSPDGCRSMGKHIFIGAERPIGPAPWTDCCAVVPASAARRCAGEDCASGSRLIALSRVSHRRALCRLPENRRPDPARCRRPDQRDAPQGRHRVHDAGRRLLPPSGLRQ
jgi:hypothetical protein